MTYEQKALCFLIAPCITMIVAAFSKPLADLLQDTVFQGWLLLALYLIGPAVSLMVLVRARLQRQLSVPSLGLKVLLVIALQLFTMLLGIMLATQFFGGSRF